MAGTTEGITPTGSGNFGAAGGAIGAADIAPTGARGADAAGAGEALR